MLSSSAVDRLLRIQTGNHGETHRPWGRVEGLHHVLVPGPAADRGVGIARHGSERGDREAVGDGQHDGFDAIVGGDVVVDGADGDGVLVLDALVGHVAAPEHVVEEHDASRAEPRHDLVVVGPVAGLVGVDERQIDRRIGR